MTDIHVNLSDYTSLAALWDSMPKNLAERGEVWIITVDTKPLEISDSHLNTDSIAIDKLGKG